MHRAPAILLAAFALAAPAVSQQTYVTRYDAYIGYAYLNSPAVKLPESGVHFQIGFRPKTWYSVGFDYTNARGDLTITPNLLPTALQQQLGAQLAQLAAAGRLPAGYKLVVPSRSETQTFTVGPQLAFRHFKQVTFFVRPSCGAMREVAIPTPKDAIAKGIVSQLTPSGRKRDWTGYFGAGAGMDINFNHHFSFRFQGDLVYDHLFNDILANGRKTVRFSIGPAFNFGRNIVER
jgi:hypothetical protein